MNRYIQISIDTKDADESDILMARLSQIGFEGFEEDVKKLYGYIPETLYRVEEVEKIIAAVKGISDPFHIFFKIEYIEPKNWNAEWEKDFTPVVVDDFCCVRAHFHEPHPDVLYDLIITPKMSFGTGHHATTFMMICAMKNITLANKNILDFGTGTGVLAILAGKMGANTVLAIDSDEWSIENAMENKMENGSESVVIRHQNSLFGTGLFDVILANINLHVIMENMAFLKQHLAPEGVFIGSGVLESDEEKIRTLAQRYHYKMERLMTKDSWMSFRLKNESPG